MRLDSRLEGIASIDHRFETPLEEQRCNLEQLILRSDV
jgi:hypothetical protein